MDLIALANIAIEAALAAGKVIRQHLHDEITVETKEGGASYASQVVTVVDRACERAILAHLLPTCKAFDLALLSEETEDDRSRFVKDFFWCVDPMDGTLAFINKRPGFSVSIALLARDGAPQIGVVYDPSTETLYHAIKGKGAYKNGQLWQLDCTNEYLTYVTDRRLDDTPRAAEIRQLLEQQAEKTGLKGIRELAGGGAVLNAIRVLEQGPACMMKLPKKAVGGGSLWDYAATACIFQEVGVPATNAAGGPLDLNRRDSSFMNHEGVCFANGMDAQALFALL